MELIRSHAGSALQISRPAEFGHGREDPLLLRNFHPAETDFVWSAGHWCEVEFPFDLANAPRSAEFFLTLELDVFRAPPVFPEQDVLVYLNGMRLGALTVRARQFASFRVRRGTLQSQANVLALDAPDAARPSDFGLDDHRLLGVKLWSLSIEKAPVTYD